MKVLFVSMLYKLNQDVFRSVVISVVRNMKLIWLVGLSSCSVWLHSVQNLSVKSQRISNVLLVGKKIPDYSKIVLLAHSSTHQNWSTTFLYLTSFNINEIIPLKMLQKAP